jgi:uncharacterized protein YsxB (DUF464 family)
VITVVVGLDSSENLVFAEASGHAGMGERGTDIVCGAVTILLRTTMTALAGSGPAIEATTAGRGSLSFRVTAFSEKDKPFLRYAARFLREGLGSLEREYPEAVALSFVSA